MGQITVFFHSIAIHSFIHFTLHNNGYDKSAKNQEYQEVPHGRIEHRTSGKPLPITSRLLKFNISRATRHYK